MYYIAAKLVSERFLSLCTKLFLVRDVFRLLHSAGAAQWHTYRLKEFVSETLMRIQNFVQNKNYGPVQYYRATRHVKLRLSSCFTV